MAGQEGCDLVLWRPEDVAGGYGQQHHKGWVGFGYAFGAIDEFDDGQRFAMGRGGDEGTQGAEGGEAFRGGAGAEAGGRML